MQVKGGDEEFASHWQHDGIERVAPMAHHRRGQRTLNRRIWLLDDFNGWTGVSR